MAEMRISKRLKIVLLALLVVALAYFPVKTGLLKLAGVIELKSMVKTFDGDSTELQSTVILPALDSPMVAGKNNIWCSTFQLAWNELKDKEFKEPIRIADALELCDTLNNATQTKDDLLADSYFVDAGKVEDGIIQRIKSGMAAKFPSEELPDRWPDGLVSYSHLEAYIKFKEPFRQREHPLSFRGSSGVRTPVKSFGVWDEHDDRMKPVREQIEVLYYKSNDEMSLEEFALDLCKHTEPYQIVVAVTEPKGSLAETYESLQQKINDVKDADGQSFSKYLKPSEIFMLPDMFWEIEHNFAEIEGKRILNSDYNHLLISKAFQSIDFRLDRTGVILKSTATIFAVESAALDPRRFVCDKPFMIYLKKRDSVEPFFVMWVDNAELLRHY